MQSPQTSPNFVQPSDRSNGFLLLQTCSAQGSPCSISPCVYASIATRSMASPAGLGSVNGGGSASWTLSSSGGLLDGVPEAKGDESVLGRDDGGRRTRFVHIPYIPFFFRKKPYKLVSHVQPCVQPWVWWLTLARDMLKKQKDFGKDLLAGVIAAVVAIPQVRLSMPHAISKHSHLMGSGPMRPGYIAAVDASASGRLTAKG